MIMLPRLLLLLLLPLSLWSQNNKTVLQIVPQPVSVQTGQSQFVLKPDTRIYYPDNKPDWAAVAQAFMALAQSSTKYALVAQPYKRSLKNLAENAVYFIEEDTIGHPEGYRLEITLQHITIRARSAAGAFYAVQTLRQLFPPLFNYPRTPENFSWTAPTCTIYDYPRFSYRGMHLDVGRHYFPVAFIKRYIDLLAIHKMNRFHWHLTEDQGWRIEINQFPKLQEVASCRKETLIGHYNDQPHRFDGTRYCGYYTQMEVKEIVQYAKERFVTIIPEIELPGHSLAALSAYPELGCTGGPYEAATKWGVFEDVYCAGNDEVFRFLEGVLTEVCALFPGEYIHIGGDECPKERWKSCAKCQKRIQEEGLKDEHELQSYFIRRVQNILAKQGRKIIGWDEILEGGLAPGATVMSWRGIEGGVAAAKSGHNAIMTPGSHCYLDHYQSDPETEPIAISGFTTLQKTYSYEPIPAELSETEAQYILGAQGNVWTEYMERADYVEYMAYPRAIALAEVTWSPRDLRNWEDFATRMLTHFTRLDMLGSTYSRAFYDVSAAYDTGKVSLRAALPLLEIRYTLDGSEPDKKSDLYLEPFAIEKSANIKAAAFYQGKKQGATLSTNINLHKASGRPYTLSKQPVQYTGGETYALTNGATGGARSWGKWVGLAGDDLDPLIDLGQTITIDSITTHFMNAKASWIYPPRSLEVWTSEDGKKFASAARLDIDADALQGVSVETVRIATPGARGRYLKVLAKNYGPIPPGAAGEGNGAWLFLDEIMAH